MRLHNDAGHMVIINLGADISCTPGNGYPQAPGSGQACGRRARTRWKPLENPKPCNGAKGGGGERCDE